MWRNEYGVNCPSSTEEFTFTATKYAFDVWGRSAQSNTWAEADYLDENGSLIIAMMEQTPQGTSVPNTLDVNIDFGDAPNAKSVLLKMWVYSQIRDRVTQYNITITRT